MISADSKECGGVSGELLAEQKRCAANHAANQAKQGKHLSCSRPSDQPQDLIGRRWFSTMARRRNRPRGLSTVSTSLAANQIGNRNISKAARMVQSSSSKDLLRDKVT